MTRMDSMSDVSFEDALAADAEALADLRVAAMRASLERVGRFDASRARARLLSSFDPAATRHIVAAGLRVGFCVVRTAPGALLLDHLYVDPRHQGRGFGAAALTGILRDADRQGLDVRLGALKESSANRFYLRHGFEPVGQSDWDIHYVRKHRGPA